MKSPTKLSLIVITFNEEHNIARCIQSVPFADEVLILDSGSTDKTCEIAESIGAKIIKQEWLGFSKQKQKATDLATNNWVLSLDADEALSDQAQDNLKLLLENSVFNKSAYQLSRKTYHLGRWLRYGGCYPDRQTRLYNKTEARWADKEVHEHIVAQSLGSIQGDILHWTFKNIEHQVQTINKYSSLRAQEMHRHSKAFSYGKLLTKPIWRFIENYFLKLGVLDGYAGFEVAVVSSFSYFLRLVKLKELNDSK